MRIRLFFVLLAGLATAGASEIDLGSLLNLGVQIGPGSRVQISGTSSFQNGLWVRYERINVKADHGGWARIPVGANGLEIVDWADLYSGPRAATAGKVLIDTMSCELPNVAVRMAVLADAFHVRRLPPRKDWIDYQMTVLNPGTFPLSIRGTDGRWLPHVIAADRIVIHVDMPIVQGELGSPVMRSMEFHSQDAATASAWVRRFRRELPWADVPQFEPGLANPEPSETVFFAVGQHFALVMSGDKLGFESLLVAPGQLDQKAFFSGNPNDPNLPYKRDGVSRVVSATAALRPIVPR